MRKIAIYGKGGIGKSTISSNLTAALGKIGVKTFQIGCDPKHDSTRLLVGGKSQNTILDYAREVPAEKRNLDDIVAPGFGGCLCTEAGGPEPGVGCAGRGIITAFDILSDLGADSVSVDLVLYDVLGDVVCGGFAVPLRNDNADTVFIVTSGEFMSIYAANNILRGTSNYDPKRMGGLIFNSRGDPEERIRVKKFSDAVGVPIVAEFDRSNIFMEAEKIGKTVVELYPEIDIAKKFINLAQYVTEGKRYTAKFLSENELERLILGRVTEQNDVRGRKTETVAQAKKKKTYASRNVAFDEPLHGCAFSGAAAVSGSITDLTTILHSPGNCAHFAFQLWSGCIRRSRNSGIPMQRGFSDPDVHCTEMDEDTVIFGGSESLEKLLRSQISEGKRNFAVISSCPAGIIGDDLKSVICNCVSDKPDIRIAYLKEDGNSAGDFMQGVIDAGIGLARTFSVRKGKKEGVNLVGTKTVSSNCPDTIEIVSALLRRIGVDVNAVFPGPSDIGSLERICNAKVDLLLNPDVFSHRLGDFLFDEYGITKCNNTVRPGLAGTGKWIREIAEIFGREREAETLMKELSEEYREMLSDLKKILKGKTYSIISMNKDVDWIIETADILEMKRSRLCIFDRADYSNDLSIVNAYPDAEFFRKDDTARIIRSFADTDSDIILSPAHIDTVQNAYQTDIPMVADPGPFSGREPAENWAGGLLAPAREGWREDAIRL